ncbi:unnamed protein product [Thelazia callipaeda]|uniref:3-isopropylmalate dehydratase large subunit n=1 Tax=Thelazia callipaeda TaxID=103827 RepID=A0A0N5CT50_THECL|nr:unnamed protein product [Thelazia callipaeda]
MVGYEVVKEEVITSNTGILGLFSILAKVADPFLLSPFVFVDHMSNTTGTRPTSGGTGIRNFFNKLRKSSDLQIPPAQVGICFSGQIFLFTA